MGYLGETPGQSGHLAPLFRSVDKGNMLLLGMGFIHPLFEQFSPVGGIQGDSLDILVSKDTVGSAVEQCRGFRVDGNPGAVGKEVAQECPLLD